MKARLKKTKNLNYRLIAALVLLSFSVALVYPYQAAAGEYDYSKYLRTTASNASSTLVGISAYANKTATNYYNAARGISPSSVTNAITSRLPTSAGIQNWINSKKSYIKTGLGDTKKSLGGIYDSVVTTAGKYKKQIGNYAQHSPLSGISLGSWGTTMISGLSRRFSQGVSALGAAFTTATTRRNVVDDKGGKGKKKLGDLDKAEKRADKAEKKLEKAKRNLNSSVAAIDSDSPNSNTDKERRLKNLDKAEKRVDKAEKKVDKLKRKLDPSTEAIDSGSPSFNIGEKEKQEIKQEKKEKKQEKKLNAALAKHFPGIYSQNGEQLKNNSQVQSQSAQAEKKGGPSKTRKTAGEEVLNYITGNPSYQAAKESLSGVSNTVSLLYGLQKNYEGIGATTVRRGAEQAYEYLVNYNNPNYYKSNIKSSAELIPNFHVDSQQVSYDAERTWDEEKGEWDYDLNVVETSRGVNTKTNEPEKWRGTYQQGEGRNYVIEKLKVDPDSAAPKKQLSAINVQNVQQPLFTPSHHKQPLAVINPEQIKILNDTNVISSKAKNPGPTAALNDSAPVAQTNVSAAGRVSILNNPDGEGKFNLSKDVQLDAYSRVVSNQTDGSLTIMKGDNNGRVYWEKQNQDGQSGKTVIAESTDDKNHSTRGAVLMNAEGFAYYQEFNGTSSEMRNPDGSAFSETAGRQKYNDFVNQTSARLGNTTKVRLYGGQEFNVQSVVFSKPSVDSDVSIDGKKTVTRKPSFDSTRTSVPGYSEQLSGVIAVSADGKNSFFIPNNLISKGIETTNEGKEKEYDYVVPRTMPVTVSNSDKKEGSSTAKKVSTPVKRTPTEVVVSGRGVYDKNRPLHGEYAKSHVTPSAAKITASSEVSNLATQGYVFEPGRIKNNGNPEKNFDVNDKYQIIAGSRGAVIDKQNNTVTSMRINPETKEVYWITENRGQGNNATKETVKGPVYKESGRSAMQKSSEGFAFYVEVNGATVERKNPDGTPFSNIKSRVTYQAFENQITNQLQDTTKVALTNGQVFDVLSVVFNKPVVSSTGAILEYPERLNGVVTTSGLFIPNNLISTGIMVDKSTYNFILPRSLSVPGERK